VSKGISAGRGQNSLPRPRGDRKSATNARNYLAVRLDVDRRKVRRTHVPYIEVKNTSSSVEQ